MKKNFPQYYRPEGKDLEQAAKDAIFIFDTNTLLDFYRVNPTIADKALRTVEQFKDRIYIAHHSDKEYHRHHYEVPAQMLNTVEQIIDKLKFNDIKTAFTNQFKCSTGCVFPQDLLNNYISRLQETYNSIAKEIGELNSHFKENFSTHSLQHRISALFEDRVLSGLSKEKLDKIVNEIGPDRYKKGMPPGYKDAGKATDTDDNNTYGDLVIWMEILELVKKEPKHVFFICRDEKEDWIEKVGVKTLGPRMELLVEFRQHAPGKIFHIYTLTRFLEYFGKDFSEEELEAIPAPKKRFKVNYKYLESLFKFDDDLDDLFDDIKLSSKNEHRSESKTDPTNIDFSEDE